MRRIGLLFVFVFAFFKAQSQDFTRFYADTAEQQTAFTLLREPDGHLWLGGTRLLVNGNHMEVWIYRLDLMGNILKRFRFPFEGYQTWAGMDFIGNNRVAAVIGNQNSGGITENWLAIMDSSHLVSYQKIEGADMAITDDLNATRSGKLLLCGFRSGGGGNNYWLGQVNQNASLDWVYEENRSPNDHIRQAKQAADGTIYFSGDIQQQSYNPVVGRLDSLGNPIWFTILASPWNDGAQKFDFDEQGRMWLTGESSTSAGAMFDTQLSIIDTGGHLVWQQMIGGPGQDAAFTIQKAENGGFWAAGYSNASTSGNGPISPFLMRLDDAGNSQGEAFWPQPSPSPVYDFEQVGDSAFYFCGINNNQAYLLKRVTPVLNPVFTVGVHSSPSRMAPAFFYNGDDETITISPQPSSSDILTLFNALGQAFYPKKMGGNRFSISHIPDGVYFLRINGFTESRIVGRLVKP